MCHLSKAYIEEGMMCVERTRLLDQLDAEARRLRTAIRRGSDKQIGVCAIRMRTLAEGFLEMGRKKRKAQ